MSAMLEAVHKSQVTTALCDMAWTHIHTQADNADKLAKLETSADHDRLTKLFEQITAVKNDSQQRGWAVHDDLSTITNCLEELLQRLVWDTHPLFLLVPNKHNYYKLVVTFCSKEIVCVHTGLLRVLYNL